MRSAFLACLMLGIAAPSLGQPSATDSVVAHYRAYTAAVGRGDVATAEIEARAAWAASEARDGGRGSTAVLALNLAQLLLEEGKKNDAVSPAQRAVQIAAENGAVSRVNPHAAALALGRAQLSDSRNGTGEALLQSIQEAVAAGGVGDSVYDAAVDLGNWALQRDAYPLALQAWQAATGVYTGDDEQSVLARAQALRGKGLAMLLLNLYRGPRQTLLGTRLNRISTDAIQPLTQAVTITRPLARRLAPDGSVTPTQTAYAQSLALLVAATEQLSALTGLGSAFRPDPEATRALVIPREGSVAPCAVSLHPDRHIEYPHDAQSRLNVGAVVVRFVLREDGSVAAASPIATTGGASFLAAVAPVSWRVEKRENAEPGCAFPAVFFATMSFRITG